VVTNARVRREIIPPKPVIRRRNNFNAVSAASPLTTNKMPPHRPSVDRAALVDDRSLAQPSSDCATIDEWRSLACEQNHCSASDRPIVKYRVIVSANRVLRHQWIVRNNRLSIKYQSVPTTESVSIGRAARLIDVAHRAIAEQRNAIERSNSAANTQMSLLVYTHKYI